MGSSVNNSHNNVDTILKQVKDMSSKFSEVGRSIVFAVIAGCWVIYDKFPDSPKVLLQISVIFAFLYLGIELWYYGSTLRSYFNFLSFSDENASVKVNDVNKSFRIQHKLQIRFFKLVYIKMVFLFLSILSLLIYVFYGFIIWILDVVVQIIKNVCCFG